jgi:hypothetical protein
MNRIEIIGLFTALKMLLESNKIEQVKTVVDEVLSEAKRKPSAEKSRTDDE